MVLMMMVYVMGLVSIQFEALMADLSSVLRYDMGQGQGRAGQGRAGQGRAGQGRVCSSRPDRETSLSKTVCVPHHMSRAQGPWHAL